jgi:glycosyltransferase 2 family protein
MSRGPGLSRRALVQGVRVVVALTVLSLAWRAWRTVAGDPAQLKQVLDAVQPGWLLVAAVFALMEGVLGGLRIFVLARVLHDRIRLRTAVISEFVLMFCAGVTPGQAGAAPSQVAVLAHSGMRLTDAWTAQLLTAWTTIVVMLGGALALIGMRASGLLVVEMGPELDGLLTVSVVVFGSGLVVLTLAALRPRMLSAVIVRLTGALVPVLRASLGCVARLPAAKSKATHAAERLDSLATRMLAEVERMFAGFATYRQRGKAACAAGLALTAGLFASRFSVAWFILLALGISTTAAVPVSPAPDFVQVLLVQGLLNFALYLSPTPGASGVAELGSASLMAPWVRGPVEVPYLVLWRLLSLFLGMLVGGVYVFRYLGTDVLAEGADEEGADETTDAVADEAAGNEGDPPVASAISASDRTAG